MSPWEQYSARVEGGVCGGTRESHLLGRGEKKECRLGSDHGFGSSEPWRQVKSSGFEGRGGKLLF